MQLSDNEVHLWLTQLDDFDQNLITRYRALMNAAELERNQRYRFDYLRDADCVTRALARTVLSRYADIAPQAWQFSAGEYGKPEISAPALSMPLRFNLSHSRQWVVCAVTRGMDLGVDIECTTRGNDVLNIADHYFSAQEVKDLFALRTEQQRSRFFDYWTLKEAYMKASGEGISLGLGNFSFSFDKQGIAISFGPALKDDPAQWQFWQNSPSADHRLAVAARTNGQPALVQLFKTVPLAESFQALGAM